LSVTEISELSKLSKAYISQVKHGNHPPSKKLLLTLKSYDRNTKTEIDYFNLFITSRQAIDVTTGTEQFYRTKLGCFLSEVNADTAQRQDIELFLLQFETPGNRHAYYRAIRTFYNWREDTFNLLSPMKKMKAPRLSKLTPNRNTTSYHPPPSLFPYPSHTISTLGNVGALVLLVSTHAHTSYTFCG